MGFPNPVDPIRPMVSHPLAATHRMSDFQLRNNKRFFIFDIFQVVLECTEFLELTVDELLTFIKDDQLDVPSEEDVFYAVVYWVYVKLHICVI